MSSAFALIHSPKLPLARIHSATCYFIIIILSENVIVYAKPFSTIMMSENDAGINLYLKYLLTVKFYLEQLGMPIG